MLKFFAGNYTNITNTTGVVVSARGGVVLHSVTFNKPVATGTVVLYDDPATTNKPIASITVPASPQPVTLLYDVTCGQGLYVIEGVVAQDITISWS